MNAFYLNFFIAFSYCVAFFLLRLLKAKIVDCRTPIIFQAEGDHVSFDSLSDLPQEPESLFPGGFEAVVEEVDEDDNPLIFSMKRECSQNQLDYCAGAKYKSGDHTMCKFCVSTHDTTFISFCL